MVREMSVVAHKKEMKPNPGDDEAKSGAIAMMKNPGENNNFIFCLTMGSPPAQLCIINPINVVVVYKYTSARLRHTG